MKMQKFYESYLKDIKLGIDQLKISDVEKLYESIMQTHSSGNKILFAGNGGSALNAGHYAMGISVISRRWSDPIRCISICDSSYLISSVSNDFSFADAYSRILTTTAKKNDLFIVLSSSGNSQNLVNAVGKAKELGIKTFALLGTDGGQLKRLCDDFIHIPSSAEDAGVAEDLHMIIGHILTGYLAQLN